MSDGRGYYGKDLRVMRGTPQRRRSWFTVVAVLGVGAAAVWLFWPRSSAIGPSHRGEAPEPPVPTSPTPTPPSPPSSSLPAPVSMATLPPATEATGAFLKQLEDDARAHGFISAKDYEDSVVATAKQLQSTGAKVVLAPHLQHLAPRLETTS